jgi:hypothetical protein
VKGNCIAVRDHIVMREDCIIVKENSTDLTVDSAALESTLLPTSSSQPNNAQSQKYQNLIYVGNMIINIFKNTNL